LVKASRIENQTSICTSYHPTGSQITTVYNLSIADIHTFYVGNESVLVHNACLQDHHIFPSEFAGFFNSRGINIDDYTVTLDSTAHLNGVHGVGYGDMPGRWNQRWADFMGGNPWANVKDVYQFGGKLMDEYGLSGMRIHPYRA
jgi:hypothetical protein